MIIEHVLLDLFLPGVDGMAELTALIEDRVSSILGYLSLAGRT
ncbi:MAG TPA: hypothetical protein VGD83_25770 [Streptosporangiaceae bacterium]